jgi:hypothetical protein
VSALPYKASLTLRIKVKPAGRPRIHSTTLHLTGIGMKHTTLSKQQAGRER